jgi:hypothetical protein
MKKVVLLIAAFAFAVSVNAQDKATPTATPVQTSPATAAPAVQENPNAGEFKFDVETYDFGTIKQGESVTYDFNFTNVGKEPLIISEAHGSCGCTVPVWPKEPLKKGDKAQIKVTFNSTGKMGMQDKTVTITSNAKGGQKVLHLKGNVEAPPAATAPATTPVQATPAPAEKK